MSSPLDRRGPVAVKPWIPPPLSVLLSRRIFARRANFSSSSSFSFSSSIGCLGSITRTRTTTRTIRLRLRRSVFIGGWIVLVAASPRCGALSFECGTLHFHHRIFQGPDSGDADTHQIVGLQREVFRRHDSRSGQEHRAVREDLAAEEKAGQLIKRPLDLTYGGLAFERRLTLAADVQLDCPVARLAFAGADDDPGPHRAGAVIDLGLWQIEQIFPFNVARTHVVADGVTDHPPARIDDQRQLRFRHVPARVFANAHSLARGDDFFWQRLEKEFRTGGIVNLVVRGSAEIRLLHAGLLAAQISDARRPDLLPANGRQ